MSAADMASQNGDKPASAAASSSATADTAQSSGKGQGKGIGAFFARARNITNAARATALPDSAFRRSLAEGLIAGGLIFLLLIGWAALRSERTALQLQPLIPSQTVAIVGAAPETASAADKSKPAIAPIIPAGDEATARSFAENKRANPLPPAPYDGLVENDPDTGRALPLSRISDDLTPFEAYRRPFTAQEGKPMIAVVVMDYGLSAQLARAVLEGLPPAVTLVLNPYAAQAGQWGAQARAHGHEFWMMLPMEASAASGTSYRDTGPLTLRVNGSLEETRERLFSVLGAATGYAGLVSQPGHSMSGQDIDVGPVMRQIFGRGLAFAESNPGIPAYGLSMALEFAYPYVQNNFWIESSTRPDALEHRLLEVERQALRKGKAIVFVEPVPSSLRTIAAWSETLPEKNLQLAPLSAMVPAQ